LRRTAPQASMCAAAMIYLRCAIGLTFFCFVAWLVSTDRKRFPWRIVTWAIALQFAFAALILKTDAGQAFFNGMADVVNRLIDCAIPGARLVFGPLGDSTSNLGFIFAFAGRGLAVIIFLSALMSVLYYLGVMQVIVWIMARIMTAFMGVSGAESTAMAANIFLGPTEAPLVIKPYLPRMTLSEMNSVMVGGYANIAGSVLAVYMGMLGSQYGPHLITSSVMSAPAAFAIAKIMVPETGQPVTRGKVRLVIERTDANVIEAATTGTSDGLKLWLNVIAMLIAFMGLVAFIDWPLGWIGAKLSIDGGLSLARIFGWVFAPIAWVMGVEGWHDCKLFGSLLGVKTAINEFVAYRQLVDLRPEVGAGDVFESVRSAKMAAYALCGFANFGTVGITIGGLTPLAPERRSEIVRLSLKAMFAGAFATWMTAVVAGALL
jgi:CNT family concentrative nucleoside transporter